MDESSAESQIEYVAETAAEIPHVDQLDEEALTVLEDGMAPEAFVAALLAKELWNDALGFFARALPIRVAIAWARKCIADALDEANEDGPGEGIEAVLESVDAWLEEPDDERRRVAFAKAQEVGLDNPPSILALAVFLSEGSMSLPDLEPVPAEEGLAHTALAGSVQLASVMFKPELAPERAQRFLDHGRAVASAAGADAEEPPTETEADRPSWPSADLESGYDLS